MSAALALVAAAAAPIAVAAQARRGTSTSDRVEAIEPAAAPTPVTLVPGAPTTFVTLGADKVLRITDTPGNAALLFIHEAQGHVRETQVEFDGIPQPPDVSDLTPGTIIISSKDQIAISTTSYSDRPVCDYSYSHTPGLEEDPEVNNHVVCQVEALRARLGKPLESTDLVASTHVDVGDRDDSVTVRADPPPEPEVEVIDTEAGFHWAPVEPRLKLLKDLRDWNVYGGAGNDWIDVNVATRAAAYWGLPTCCHTPPAPYFDPDKYGDDWVDFWHLTVARIWGGDGNDTLTAGRGRDYVYGENGNDSIVDLPQRVDGTKDQLYGGPGNDTVDGRNGPDTLDGGSGIDTINGGPGKDQIYANDGEADQVACGSRGDVLYHDVGKDAVFSC